MEKNGNRVLVAMSGGVDSSVAAWLLREQGYECVGATMKLFGKETEHSADRRDAEEVAEKLGIPYFVFRYSEEFEEQVIRRFVDSYERGETPNPCVDCNRYLKFGLLLQKARELGCDYLATGHYARISMGSGGIISLKKGMDPGKDQSYFLYSLTQPQLEHVLFPLGELSKERVRQIAEEQGFSNARKQDSQDICFIPGGDYLAFIERYRGDSCEPGNLLDEEGNVLGTHRGAAGYTIGQRRGLGFPAGHRVYVTGKNMKDNTVTLGPESSLYSSGCLAGDWNWILPPGSDPVKAMVKIRHSRKEQPVQAFREGPNRVRIRFQSPQRAVTPGQSAVLYQGDTVLGGGRILEAESAACG